MHLAFNLQFHSPWLLMAAGVLAVAVVVVAGVRRARMRWVIAVPAVLGLGLLAGAAGEPVWVSPQVRSVVVMVDLSASTRTAEYREPQALQNRLDELLGDTPRRVVYFSDRNADDAAAVADRGQRTVLSPPAADAVVLFGDANFNLPDHAPPVFVVVDPALEAPTDASLQRLELTEDEIVLATANAGATRPLLINNQYRADVGRGSQVMRVQLNERPSQLTARLAPGDSWPENDAMTLRPPPPRTLQRWWVGESAPDGPWVRLDPQQLPHDARAYLAPAVVVLDDVSVDELTATQQQALAQYVRDLGGGLVLLGGDGAFAAGAYPGTVLDALSPLASTPPHPTTHWILLADGSGSMAAEAGGTRRWDRAIAAVQATLPRLPPDDPVSVGDFAENVRWWTTGLPAREAKMHASPPPDAAPHGPTNLQAALEQIAASASGTPTRLLLLTDAEAKIDAPRRLAAELRDKQVSVHLLAISPISQVDPLVQIVGETSGSLVQEADANRWADSLIELATAAGATYRVDRAEPVQFTDALSDLPPRPVGPWNRTWLKAGAVALAETVREREVLAARWNRGVGRVVAAGFRPEPHELARLLEVAQAPPRDPRFTVRWEQADRLHVRLDARDERNFFNDLRPELVFGSETGRSQIHPIPQTAPGRYELSLPAPRESMLAMVRLGDAVLDRRAVAGRYPAEFERIGNDATAMRQLANRTGGKVIRPEEPGPIKFHPSRRDRPLTAPLAAAAAACLATALFACRLR